MSAVSVFGAGAENSVFFMEKALYWDNTYELVQALEAAHPALDLEQMRLAELYRYVVALPQFADDPSLANDGILKDLLREWYEESLG